MKLDNYTLSLLIRGLGLLNKGLKDGSIQDDK